MQRPAFTPAFAAAGAALALLASPVLAGDERPTRNVSISFIDLTTPEGQKMLDRRIEAAARDVCRVGEHRTGTRIPSYAARTCMKKALAGARQQVAARIEQQKRGG